MVKILILSYFFFLFESHNWNDKNILFHSIYSKFEYKIFHFHNSENDYWTTLSN